jgi:tetratricopeptide (TPR) repeat protein
MQLVPRYDEAFKEGNYPQAAVFYTQTLELAPAHHVALANRSACFLKLGEHEKALADAEACVAAKPDFLKGHFRKGMSLHAMVGGGCAHTAVAFNLPHSACKRRQV